MNFILDKIRANLERQRRLQMLQLAKRLAPNPRFIDTVVETDDHRTLPVLDLGSDGEYKGLYAVRLICGSERLQLTRVHPDRDADDGSLIMSPPRGLTLVVIRSWRERDEHTVERTSINNENLVA